MYQNFVPGAVSIATGTDPITAYNNATRRENLFNQTDFVWVKTMAKCGTRFWVASRSVVRTL